MRKILVTYIPASMLLAFLAMVLLTFGGCGGDGGGGSAVGGGGGNGGGEILPAATLTGLSITGPSSMSETSTAMFTAIASWSDNSTSMVTPTWSVDSQMASINPGGELCCHGIDNDQLVTITATYSSGEITKTATMDVTITNKTITLTGLSINGPSSVSETSTATYTATASWSDSSTSTVTPTWSVNSQMASISAIGVLSCQAIDSDQMVTVTATYSSGGITKTATMDVTITNITTTLSVVITGTVPGAVAIAYGLATGKEAARNVASGTSGKFTLNVDPGTYYLMFLANEGTPSQRPYAFQNVTGKNVFTCKANTTLDLGVLVFNNYPRTATPLVDPLSGNANVTETFMREASFSPGAGEWIATRKFVNSTCFGTSPGTTVTENVKIAQGWGIVTFTPAGTTETAIGVANVNTAILTASSRALVTIYLTMQSDGSLAGTYSKVGYGGDCSEDATITAVLK
jgi:hypothetical protein